MHAYTVAAVIGHGFIAQDLTIENTAGPVVPASPALALRSDSNNKSLLINRCRLEGHQDTLWAPQNNVPPVLPAV
uniref:Pectinesterase n=1 Tax=Oryza brachyantha TaxID=4533 RepID=J3MKT2_ORYBR